MADYNVLFRCNSGEYLHPYSFHTLDSAKAYVDDVDLPSMPFAGHATCESIAIVKVEDDGGYTVERTYHVSPG